MTLAEYYRAFQQCLAFPLTGDLPQDVAAAVAAGFAIGLPPEQLRQFMARCAEVKSVTAALVSATTSPEVIERILAARKAGCVYPKEVLTNAFAPHEVRAELREAVFGERAGGAEADRPSDRTGN